ncbi:hypothetical protein V496_10263 [Pseudogymnoascus sp. VKM F-4515 (FW-2607)]|nr:hypothetical protein V496_10263 [Pseudogymnoascus sp. VKM F-4515 (FW-2607)]
MIEVWARGNNIWRQLEFSPCSSASDADGDVAKPLERVRGEEEDGEREPRDLEVYGKVFEAETVEWVRSDGFGSIVKYNSSSHAIAGSPTPFLLLGIEEGDVGRQNHALLKRHAQALRRNGMGKGWAVSGTGMVVAHFPPPRISLSHSPSPDAFLILPPLPPQH